MAGPQLYVLFPGTAREALHFYAEIFGGALALFSYADFKRNDGPPTAVAHGMLQGAWHWPVRMPHRVKPR